MNILEQLTKDFDELKNVIHHKESNVGIQDWVPSRSQFVKHGKSITIAKTHMKKLTAKVTKLNNKKQGIGKTPELKIGEITEDFAKYLGLDKRGLYHLRPDGSKLFLYPDTTSTSYGSNYPVAHNLKRGQYILFSPDNEDQWKIFYKSNIGQSIISNIQNEAPLDQKKYMLEEDGNGIYINTSMMMGIMSGFFKKDLVTGKRIIYKEDVMKKEYPELYSKIVNEHKTLTTIITPARKKYTDVLKKISDVNKLKERNKEHREESYYTNTCARLEQEKQQALTEYKNVMHMYGFSYSI